MKTPNLKKSVLEFIEKKKSFTKDEISNFLISKYKIGKKNQRKFKTQLYINYLSKLTRDKIISRIGKGIYSTSFESKSIGFVNQFAERIPIGKLTTLKKVLYKKFRKKMGFYFLYKGKKLYYVGIGDVIKRLYDHTTDEHKNKWNMFSFYITEKIDHAKQIESVIQRNIQLDGNTKKGKLGDAQDVTGHINKFDELLQDIH